MIATTALLYFLMLFIPIGSLTFLNFVFLFFLNKRVVEKFYNCFDQFGYHFFVHWTTPYLYDKKLDPHGSSKAQAFMLYVEELDERQAQFVDGFFNTRC